MQIVAITSLTFALVLASCASGPPLGRDKSGATVQEFLSNRYSCLQESSARVSGAAVNSYGGVASSQISCNYQMYDACMTARGYFVVPNGRFQAPVGCAS